MKAVYIIFVFSCLGAYRAAAQSPIPAGTGRLFEASVGYSYVSAAALPSSRTGLSGVDTSVTVSIPARLGLRADLGYVRGTNVLGHGHNAAVLSYLGGPVFYPTSNRHLLTYVHGLIGAARVSGPVAFNGGGIWPGWANKLSWAFGAGVEYWVSDSMAFRTGADYLHTAFFDSSLALRGQNNFRTTGSFVYFFGRRSRRTH